MLDIVNEKYTESVFNIKKSHTESNLSIKASYIIAQKIAAKSKPFTDDEFIKKCMETVFEILCPAQKQLFSKFIS